MLASFLLLLLALISSMGLQSSLAQSGGELYFKETRHWVKGEFLTKYRSASNPLKLYGYPITEAFFDPVTKQFIQYFQKARFELHPEAPPGQRVQLSSLGKYIYERGQPVPNINNSPTCRKFENGYYVCFALLRFFDENGGKAQFGEPISNLEYQNDVMVQYFEYARFEWRLDYPVGDRLVLGNLGSEHFFKVGSDLSLLNPVAGEFTIEESPKNILSLKVRAYPLRAVTPRNSSQTIFIVVQDQTLLPVEGAQITITIRSPSGKERGLIVRERTNASGLTQISFPFDVDSVGIFQIFVTATRDNLEAKTVTSFRAWW